MHFQFWMFFAEHDSMGPVAHSGIQTAVQHILDGHGGAIQFHYIDARYGFQFLYIGGAHGGAGLMAFQGFQGSEVGPFLGHDGFGRVEIRFGEADHFTAFGRGRDPRNHHIRPAALEGGDQGGEFHIGDFHFLPQLLGDVIGDIHIDASELLGLAVHIFKRRESGRHGDPQGPSFFLLGCFLFAAAAPGDHQGSRNHNQGRCHHFHPFCFHHFQLLSNFSV